MYGNIVISKSIKITYVICMSISYCHCGRNSHVVQFYAGSFFQWCSSCFDNFFFSFSFSFLSLLSNVQTIMWVLLFVLISLAFTLFFHFSLWEWIIPGEQMPYSWYQYHCHCEHRSSFISLYVLYAYPSRFWLSTLASKSQSTCFYLLTGEFSSMYIWGASAILGE